VVIPEAKDVLDDFGAYLEAHPSEPTIEWAEFLAWARVARRAGWKPQRWEVYTAIVDSVAAIPTASPTIVERFVDMDYAGRLAKLAEEALHKGTPGALDKAAVILDEYRARVPAGTTATATAEPALAEMLDDLLRKDGLEWRLEDLNRSVGPVHPGDVVLIGARPEVGKTTLLTSEITHMARQLPEGKHALWINNEEARKKILVRLRQSALALSVPDLAADPSKAEKLYEKIMAGHRVDVVHDTALTTGGVERLLKTGQYGIIGFNLLDKVKGFSVKGEENEVARLRALGIWVRGLADKYNVAVFALAQADASAEGQRVLHQGQLYGTKTGLVAESDAQIMIGKDNAPGMGGRRFINVVRNKLPGGSRTLPSNRHGVFEVGFDGERARYESLAFAGSATGTSAKKGSK
jgi:hypothetical protein